MTQRAAARAAPVVPRRSALNPAGLIGESAREKGDRAPCGQRNQFVECAHRFLGRIGPGGQDGLEIEQEVHRHSGPHVREQRLRVRGEFVSEGTGNPYTDPQPATRLSGALRGQGLMGPWPCRIGDGKERGVGPVVAEQFCVRVVVERRERCVQPRHPVLLDPHGTSEGLLHRLGGPAGAPADDRQRPQRGGSIGGLRIEFSECGRGMGAHRKDGNVQRSGHSRPPHCPVTVRKQPELLRCPPKGRNPVRTRRGAYRASRRVLAGRHRARSSPARCRPVRWGGLDHLLYPPEEQARQPGAEAVVQAVQQVRIGTAAAAAAPAAPPAGGGVVDTGLPVPRTHGGIDRRARGFRHRDTLLPFSAARSSVRSGRRSRFPGGRPARRGRPRGKPDAVSPSACAVPSRVCSCGRRSRRRGARRI